MRHLLVWLGVFLIGSAVWSASASAQAGGPELRTDDPNYPGEGALSTVPRVLAHAWAVPRGSLGSTTNREKMIRLFLWRAEHYGHLHSPAVYNLPNISPSPKDDNTLMTDYDAMRGMFSYGWGVCGTNHAQMRVFADELGWPSRRRSLQGDTGYEIQVDPNVPAGADGWRYFNTDQYTLHFLSNSPTAHFASLDQVVTTNHHYAEWNPDLGLGYRLPQANTHGSYQDFAGVTGTVANRSQQWVGYYQGVWKVTSDNNAPLYGEGYTSTPVVVHLKRGETFTRWATPSGAPTDLGLTGRAWWGFNGGNLGGGDNSPYLQWSFVQNAPARDQAGAVNANPEASALVGQRYGNGCFLWTPNLSLNEHLDGTLQTTGTLATGGSPALRSNGSSTLVLFHNAPYTIAARPSDGTDPAVAGAKDGAIISADTAGVIPVEISTNAGATWASIGSLSGTGAKLDFTDNVKGRNQYLLRLSFTDGQGLNALSLRTLTMVSQGVYPNLKSGTAQVSYAASNTGALELSPDLWTAASANSASGYVQKVADSGNVNSVFYSGSTVAYTATDNNPMSVTYKITVPPQLAAAGATFKQIFAGANALVGVTPEGGPFTKIEISSDQTNWTSIGQYAPPADDQFSAYWAYGRSADGSAVGGTTRYVRYTTSNGPHPANLRFLRLSATYTLPASAAPLTVTYFWSNGSNQNQSHTVAAGASSDSWSISTGANVVQQKVVLAVGSGAAAVVAPSITTHPSNQTVTAGQTATFSVVATGTAPLTYQWQNNNGSIAGATGPSYTTPPTQLSDSGLVYKVVVTNGAGSATSNGATLTVNAAPGGGGGGGGSPVTVTLQQGTSGYSGATDTYIDADPAQVGNSFGNIDKMEIRYIDSGGTITEHMISMLRFDLSSIPSTATITSATLKLFVTRVNSNGASDVLSLEKALGAWNDTWTWSMGVPSSTPSGVTCPSVAGYATLPAPYTITGLGSLVQGWVTTPSSNLGMLFTTTSNLNFRFATSEYSVVADRPALEITYTTASGGGGGGAPPGVSVNTPPSSTSTSPLLVSGSASGSSAITQVTWSNAATGASGTASGTSSWSASIPLQSGPNTITITATDSNSQTGSSTFTVTYSTSAAPSGSSSSGSDDSGGGGHHMCGVGVAGSSRDDAWTLYGILALLLALCVKRPMKG
ncbi:MAG: DNRLRE domain-containing protein [Planctomycetaceae bacterium]|nr:DNRLRE domain-containing protein [Planctomycetaceae bacterium]